MRIPNKALLALIMPILICMPKAFANETSSAVQRNQFTYAWPFQNGDHMQPRGGNSNGPEVVLDYEDRTTWKALQEPGIQTLERDRRAILAMAGPYRTSFDFIETIGLIPNYKPTRPYQSWGTEYVYVVANEKTFISLQHIIVMFFKAKDGTISGPAVVKHWRQDWNYQDQDLHIYVGRNTWQRQTLTKKQAKGHWSQSVFQVDDSPRYQATGKWQHDSNFSSWQSENTWRPLPRREFSIRKDYQVLSGTNRLTITPNGWVQEEDNLKLVLDEDGKPLELSPYLAREAGLNRYERITNHDFTAGDAYWQRTTPFWSDVRKAWHQTLKQSDRFVLKSHVNDKKLYALLFDYAESIKDSKGYDSIAGQAFIQSTLASFLK
ncbi:MAG: hypothetical protein KUG75_07780 [Pseudomonadales bacterium]|nr:hypothetical protein [Pseudomonadales bacterium]